MAYGADGPGDMLGPAIGQIIAIHRGDDHMAQAQFLDRRRNPAGFERVQRIGTAGGHIAERTAPRADLAHDHHGCVPLGPTFADIGAGRFFADRCQIVIPHQTPGFVIRGVFDLLLANPFRFARDDTVGLLGLFRVTWSKLDGHLAVLTYAWIARPMASRQASLTASPIAGCA